MPLPDRLRIAAVDLAVTGAPRALAEAAWLASALFTHPPEPPWWVR